ncbi:DUF3488 and transglutaminase-like domain-containing protein [Demequina sp. SYSU T00039]|uniref:DUF3488 and transglutaminase-like domain-containing protein n=1 Tax=Demequina lignilytica TaxID=3051663 RepID=A0AAW7M1H7_9MICO|nr:MULTISPECIES: DUF3488 and transglutaminase-like domain-containing protein [unclassified Demequina]MDN4477126.1 DUF3488 and transglutaminase-like domain-containing protein [Demequina sp. SYSU T00039-1]MDN4487299.1 DUF3488 and transglutaminase-like domain-containing protein [Demequina sp. SYSU T00039]MDN4491550.1 DUF3488 and transglutaminase-like domain-containing protein [Demequina sp. SYSU T00068]
MSRASLGGAAARTWATPAVAITVALSLAGVAALLEPGGWYRTPATILGATALVVVIARLATRRAFVPTAIGGLVGAWLVLLAYVPAPDGGRSWWPSPGALRSARDMAVDAVGYVYDTVAPAPVTVPLEALLATAALALFLAADALAVGAGLAATSGILLLAPWIPPLALGADVPVGALVGCLALWLATVALTRRSTGTRWRSRAADAPATGGVVLGAASLAVLLAVAIAPLAPGVPGWGDLPRATLPSAWGGGQRLDLEIDLRDSLTARSDEPFLVYTSASGRVPVLRAFSRADFDGNGWRVETPTETEQPSGPLWPLPYAGWVGDQTRSFTVRVGDVRNAFVPIPDAPRSVSAAAGWTYAPSSDELRVGEGDLVAFAQYSVKYATGFHTEEALRAAEAAIAAGGDAEVEARYVAVPDALDQDGVRALAEEVTAGAADRYEMARQLQDYLSGDTFAYRTDVDYDGDDMVSAFLEDRAGYCIHFATTMVMMARTLDIPARFAVGFLGGTDTGGSEFVVTGGDAHAWPEIYFPGHGWVRFEPTPPIQTGAPPEYAAPEAGPEAVPDVRDTIRPTAAPSTATTSPSATATAVTDPVAEDEQPWAFAIAVGALVLTALALAVAAARLAARRRVLDPERAWQSALRAVDGGATARAQTPAEARETPTLAQDEWTDDEREAWRRLAAAVEDHRYAPGGSTATPEELGMWVAAIRRAGRRTPRRGSR